LLNNIAGILAPSSSPGDYESIATTVVGSGGQATVSFTVIPSTYKHLQIRYFGRATSGDNPNVAVQFNSDTAANYRAHYLGGAGSGNAFAGDLGAGSSTNIGWMPGSSQGTNVFGAAIVDVLDYANTNKFKTIRSLDGADNNGGGLVGLWSGLWRSTSAITRIDTSPASGNWAQYTSIALYGIKG